MVEELGVIGIIVQDTAYVSFSAVMLQGKDCCSMVEPMLCFVYKQPQVQFLEIRQNSYLKP